MDQAPVSPLPKDTHLSGIIIIIIITSLDHTMQYLIILSGWLVGWFRNGDDDGKIC